MENTVFSSNAGNHLLPFLWMHEGHTSELKTLVKQIYDSGAMAFCVESRPHEQFCRQGWWDDMDIILSEAERLNMKVWILDDKHFPTGYANGIIDEKYPNLRRWHLIEQHVDVTGPAKDSAILINKDTDDEVLGVYAYKRYPETENIPAETVELAIRIRGRYAYFDVPEGVYRIFVLLKSRRGNTNNSYISQLNAESTHALIEAVYEPHYEHYARYFGNTIAGFFSDEPSFGNTRYVRNSGRADMYNQTLGLPGLALPWSDEVPKLMQEELNRDVIPLLPGLWFTQGDSMPEVRIAYMNAVTQLWQKNFSYQIGDWCRAHNVEYIGHVIEDMNAHARLHCSGGHYFRSLDGQDMAGIDVVLHQIVPGLSHYPHAASCSGGMADPEFFDYVLARLATSLSHIQPRMKHRAMCEIFGAYGWAESLPFMKRLMDHMLVRGINYFVPHAFSPAYPDPDCPPHFNAGGDNPQAEGFAHLMRYTNKAADILSDGIEIVGAAILYHAEAEWSGMDYMLAQKPAKCLYDAQINYDILPIDAVMEAEVGTDGSLLIGKMRFPVLIIPYAKYLPDDFIGCLRSLGARGLRYVFVDGRPDNCDFGEVIALDKTADYTAMFDFDRIRTAKPFPLLRSYCVKNEKRKVFMLVNESAYEEFDDEIILPHESECVKLGLLQDETEKVDLNYGSFRLKLAPGESVFIIAGDSEGLNAKENVSADVSCELAGPWDIAYTSAHGRKTSLTAGTINRLFNITGSEGDDSFSGSAIYETEFDINGDALKLDLGNVGDCSHVWLNGVDLGVRIHAPYTYDISCAVKSGKNRLRIIVTNTLVHQQPDHFSVYMQIMPSGLLGPVKVYCK